MSNFVSLISLEPCLMSVLSISTQTPSQVK